MYRMLKMTLDAKAHVESDYPLLDWALIEDLVVALREVAKLTEKMQAEVYAMGDFFRDLFVCCSELEDITTDRAKKTSEFPQDSDQAP